MKDKLATNIDKPWAKRQFADGEILEIYGFDTYSNLDRFQASLPLAKGEVIGTVRNKYGRISYKMRRSDGAVKAEYYEWLRRQPTEEERKRELLKKAYRTIDTLRSVVSDLTEEQQQNLISRLEQLCNEFRPQQKEDIVPPTEI